MSKRNILKALVVINVLGLLIQLALWWETKYYVSDLEVSNAEFDVYYRELPLKGYLYSAAASFTLKDIQEMQQSWEERIPQEERKIYAYCFAWDEACRRPQLLRMIRKGKFMNKGNDIHQRNVVEDMRLLSSELATDSWVLEDFVKRCQALEENRK